MFTRPLVRERDTVPAFGAASGLPFFLVRWLGLCGRILGIALIGAVFAGMGFGLTRPVNSALPPCLSYVHTTKCLQPGEYVNRIPFPPLAVGAILAAIWLTPAILLVRGWLHPDPDWV